MLIMLWLSLSGRCSRRPAFRHPRSRLALEALEDRCVPTLTAADHGLLVFDNDAVDLKADGTKGAAGVYWLANANLAATQTFGIQGINPDGSMTWETALNWVAAMNTFNNGAGYLGHNNWTLPLTPNVDPNHKATQSGPGGDSFGFNFYSSLFGHLFYTELGGKKGVSVTSLPAANRLFTNFQPDYYWGGDLLSSTRSTPVDFSFNTGYLATDVHIDFEFALPEFSVDPNDKPVAPRANFVYSLQSLSPSPSLSPNPDGQTVHDGALNINWLANANLAATTTFGVAGINANGTMDYNAALAWIAAMNAADYLGHNNWRLPTSDNAETSDYYRLGSELGELFYTELGSQAGSTIQLTHDAEYGLFSNFQAYHYWTSTAVPNGDGTFKTDSHETFAFSNGYRCGNTDPNEMCVIPVFDGNVLTVTSSLDDASAGTLRAETAAAQPGDTIEFSPGLVGATITLQSPIDVGAPIYFVGPGADELTVSGGKATGIFNVGPYAPGTAVTLTTGIDGLALENGRTAEGGAILDRDASLILNADLFQQDQAAGGSGGDGLGGALAVLADTTTGMVVTVMHCQFSNDSAVGGPGVNGDTTSGLAPTGAGAGEGGAVFVSAGAANQPSFTFSADTFSHDAAVGGPGGAGAAGATNQNGQNGASGGGADGGAIYYTDGSAAGTGLSVAGCTFTSDSASGGMGGAGGAGTGSAAKGGNGGHGGLGAGGALGVLLSSSSAGTVSLSGDVCRSNAAVGGQGGRGGSGDFAGGGAGTGGSAQGGAVLVAASQAAGSVLTIRQSKLIANVAQGGNGGAGGTGFLLGVGGRGGDGAGALGGGLDLNGPGGSRTLTWTLSGDTLGGNIAASGGGGNGGGGNGGNSASSLGGGAFDGFRGTLDLLACALTTNQVQDGAGGAGGFGPRPGLRGHNSPGLGGGLAVDAAAAALARADTHILGNAADVGPNVYGKLGTI
jgi:hypothetical protein